MRILLVDDDNFSRKLMGMYLKNLDAETVLLPGGQECLDSVAEQAPEIILMDCQMPGMDGFETVTELRKRGYKGIVLALTANSDEATLQRCTACGMNGHISKPVNAATLQERILGAMSEKPAQPVPEPEAPASGQRDPLERLRGLTMATRNSSLFSRLIGSFIKSVDESIESLKDALCKEDGPGVAAAAHRIRGSAGSFGAADFSEVAGALEDKLNDTPLEHCKSQAQDILHQWGPLRSYLENAGGSQ